MCLSLPWVLLSILYFRSILCVVGDMFVVFRLRGPTALLSCPIDGAITAVGEKITTHPPRSHDSNGRKVSLAERHVLRCVLP